MGATWPDGRNGLIKSRLEPRAREAGPQAYAIHPVPRGFRATRFVESLCRSRQKDICRSTARAELAQGYGADHRPKSYGPLPKRAQVRRARARAKDQGSQVLLEQKRRKGQVARVQQHLR